MTKEEQQKKRNDEIRSFVARKEENNETYTKKELEYIQQYEGAGGLAKAGEANRGLLYEYYTPMPVVRVMWKLAFKHGFTSGNILEPSCGTGRFFYYVNPQINYVDAYEYAGKDNTTSYDIAKVSFPFVNITNAQFESHFYEGYKLRDTKKRYDLVIGNPPYGDFSGLYAGMEQKRYNVKRYEEYFIEAGVDVLKQNGLLVYIVPSSVLQGRKTDFKERLDKKAQLRDAYRLPENIFKTTKMQTDIIVLKKR